MRKYNKSDRIWIMLEVFERSIGNITSNSGSAPFLEMALIKKVEMEGPEDQNEKMIPGSLKKKKNICD